MGEASRRKAEINQLKERNSIWFNSLSETERVVADVAQRAYEKIVVGMGMTEGCYHLSFFMNAFLRLEHDIETKVVVGWVNDGEWAGAASHAWLIFEGKKVDISLHRTSHPDVQLPGDLIILDHVIKNGQVQYEYWLAMPESAQNALIEMTDRNSYLRDAIANKHVEHARMVSFANSTDGALKYLEGAPTDSSYASLARLI